MVKKSKKILGWFKPTSPVKGLVLFAIIFAIAGGGFYAYKSKAAGLQLLPSDFHAPKGGFISTDCNGNKGCVQVMTLRPDADTGRGAVAVNFPTSKSIYVCYSARAQISLSKADYAKTILQVETNNGTGWYGLGTVNNNISSIPQSLGYQEYCNGVTVPPGQRFLSAYILHIATTNTTPDVYLAYVSFRW